jgi:regulator of sirC expression with transglutaminase-like and TPR domain
MRRTKPSWLFWAALLVGVLLTAAWPSGAQAQLRSAALACSNQSAKLADKRISACTHILNSGRLSGKPLGVAYALRGLAYLDRGDIPAAIVDLNRAVENAPDFAPAYQNRGNARYAQGNNRDALADYDRTIKLDPDVASAYVNRAWVRRDLGMTDEALADFAKAISLSPDNFGAYSGRGQLYLRQKQYTRALADLNRAVRLAPTAHNYGLRAQAYAEQQQAELAAQREQDAAKRRQAELAAQKAKKEKAEAAAAAAASAPKLANTGDTAKPAAPAVAMPVNTAAREDTDAARRTAAPQPQQHERSQRTRHERKANARRASTRVPSSSIWVDEHGRRLSAREVREVQRLLRHSHAPVRYYPPGSRPSFDEIFR